MPAIEKHAISLYTRKAGQLFSAEVDKSADYNVVQGLASNEVRVIHNNEEVRKKWARVVFTVRIEDNGGRYVCECGLYEHFGILCCHSLKVSYEHSFFWFITVKRVVVFGEFQMFQFMILVHQPT
jgi:hypothetical protein